jgi:hypothetical protein
VLRNQWKYLVLFLVFSGIALVLIYVVSAKELTLNSLVMDVGYIGLIAIVTVVLRWITTRH